MTVLLDWGCDGWLACGDAAGSESAWMDGAAGGSPGCFCGP